MSQKTLKILLLLLISLIILFFIFKMNEYSSLQNIKVQYQNLLHYYNKNSIEASHHGYSKEHRRNFKFKKNCIEVIDKFERESYISLNIAPNIEIIVEDLKIILKDNEDIINLHLKEISKIEIVEGFYSKEYGKRIKNKRIILKRKSEFSKLNFEIN